MEYQDAHIAGEIFLVLYHGPFPDLNTIPLPDENHDESVRCHIRWLCQMKYGFLHLLVDFPRFRKF
jgi:hypothetical protein